MYTEILQQLGLAKNEAKIYETLLNEGESSVGQIANKSKVHRRNVYDSLNRLIEKGLVFEILQKNENHYQAVDPSKLTEIIQEKEHALAKIMPNLTAIYEDKAHKEEVYIYRGLEGWKNYMRDILRIGEDNYTIGAKGAWKDERLQSFFQQFTREAEKRGIKFHLLFDHEVKNKPKEFIKHLGEDYQFLPKEFSTSAAIDVFGDHVVILSNAGLGKASDETIFTVIINQQIADAYRTWFKFMWDMCPDSK